MLLLFTLFLMCILLWLDAKNDTQVFIPYLNIWIKYPIATTYLCLFIFIVVV